MAIGISTSLANSSLSLIPNTIYVQLHIGDPGASGTANVSSTVTRVAATMGAASAGTRSMTAPIEWAPWSTGVTETISHLSAWDAATGGTFVFSTTVASPQELSDGKITELTTMSIAHATIAA